MAYELTSDSFGATPIRHACMYPVGSLKGFGLVSFPDPQYGAHICTILRDETISWTTWLGWQVCTWLAVLVCHHKYRSVSSGDSMKVTSLAGLIKPAS